MQNDCDESKWWTDGGRQGVDLIELILNEIGGTFKKYQVINYILFCIPFALSGTFNLSYVFTALDLDYRCFISECDTNGNLTSKSGQFPNAVFGNLTFEPPWLPNVVPYRHEKPTKCRRYERRPSENTTHLRSARGDKCPADDYNHAVEVKCDRFVYKTDEVTILNEFGLECDEDWKLTAVGTANNVARLIFTPVMGHLSDCYGRRTILIIAAFGSASLAYMRSFAPTYEMFLLFEFLDACVDSVIYSASFILAMEWIGVKNRVLLGTLITATYPLGQIFLGLIAREVRNFRYLLQIVYAPGFFIITYYWIAPESIRWLIVNRKKTRTMEILAKAERINKTKISQNTMDLLSMEFSHQQSSTTESASHWHSFRQVFQKRVFFVRFLVCAFVWITNAFVTYGISLTSVSLAGDKYINFVVIACAGIPAMLFCYILMESCGRRWAISSSLLISGASIIGSKVLPANFSILSITLFFIGKCFITVAFTGLYVYTSELWPTNMRHGMMGLCSTIGRIGSICANLAPMLSYYMEILPFLVFGGISIVAAILILKLPETLNRKLPDTMLEAEKIGFDSVDETS